MRVGADGATGVEGANTGPAPCDLGLTTGREGGLGLDGAGTVTGRGAVGATVLGGGAGTWAGPSAWDGLTAWGRMTVGLRSGLETPGRALSTEGPRRMLEGLGSLPTTVTGGVLPG